ncbi:MAG: hypothetical protein HPY59_02215 [Anaerolineae bacterium]|nr:hypothetical protein [Anaerolineae bacterium]
MEPNLQVRKILTDLNYDFRAFTIEHFANWIEKAKGREIHLIPWQMPSGLFGAWMSDGENPREFFFFRENAERLLQIHIQLHELSHYLCGHPTKIITKKQIQDALEKGIALPFDEMVKLRSPEMNAYEYEAESLASLIQEQIIRNSQIEQLTRGISSDKKVADSLKNLGLI